MAFTFLAAQGHDVGGSLVDRDRIDDCAALLASGTPILLPTDIVALEPGADVRMRLHRRARCGSSGRDVPEGWRASTSGPRRWRLRRRASARPAPCCGTGPWASSRTSASRRDGRAWPAAVAECRGFTVVGGGDSVGRRRRAGPGRRDRLHLHRRGRLPRAPRVRRPARAGRAARRAQRTPAAGLAAGESPERDRPPRRPLDQRQLEDAPRPPRGARTRHGTSACACSRPTSAAVDVSVHPPFTDLRSVQTGHRGQTASPWSSVPSTAPRGPGRLHRRGEPAMLARLESLRDRRPLRAAPVLRRDRRGRGRHAAGRPAQRHDPHLLRGGDRSRSARRA